MAIITVSRGTFSGGQILAECVAEKLGYRCISREILLEAAREYGVPAEVLSKALGDKPGILERLTSERAHYLTCIRAALIREARTGKLVYHGHAGHLLLKDVPHVLTIRVIANMDFRIQSLVEHHNLSKERAIQYIEKMDEERARWTRFLYHVDWQDPTLYDLVINLNHMDLTDACDIVCYMADAKQFKVTPQWQKTMDNLVLSNHLMAIIANNKSISGEVEIKASEGVVTLMGSVESLVDADRVRMIVRNVPGVKEVRSRMQVRLVGVPVSGNEQKLVNKH